MDIVDQIEKHFLSSRGMLPQEVLRPRFVDLTKGKFGSIVLTFHRKSITYRMTYIWEFNFLFLSRPAFHQELSVC